MVMVFQWPMGNYSTIFSVNSTRWLQPGRISSLSKQRKNTPESYCGSTHHFTHHSLTTVNATNSRRPWIQWQPSMLTTGLYSLKESGTPKLVTYTWIKPITIVQRVLWLTGWQLIALSNFGTLHLVPSTRQNKNHMQNCQKSFGGNKRV